LFETQLCLTKTSLSLTEDALLIAYTVTQLSWKTNREVDETY